MSVKKKETDDPTADPEYLNKRERNNKAVQKSREKSKLKQAEMQKQIDFYSEQNDELVKSIETVKSSINVCKDALLSNYGDKLKEEELKTMLENIEHLPLEEAVEILANHLKSLEESQSKA